MLGTAPQHSWLDRVTHTLTALDRAFKAAPPSAAELYPPQTGYGAALPISFPGWDVLERQSNTNSADERRAKTAVTSPWVYSDISAIANEAASAELVVKERKGNKLVDVENHELERLWESPNPHMGRSYLVAFWMWSYVLASKAYLFWMPSATAETGWELWPIPPFMIQPLPAEKDFIGGYGFKSSATAKSLIIAPEYITFSHSVNLFDIRDGLSFLVAAMLGIETDLAAAMWNRNFFKESNGIPDGFISVPRDTLDPDLERVRMEIRAFFGGTRRGVAIARGGDLKYEPWGRSQKDAEFLGSRQFDQKAVDRTLLFPEGYWSERANRANAEQARATMIAGAVWPPLVRMAEDMNAQTVQRWWGVQFRVEFKDIRPEDRALKLQEMQFYAQFETLDELRARIGDKPIGDVRGLMLVAEIGKGAATPTSTPSDAIEDALAEKEAEAAVAAPPEETALPEEEIPSDATEVVPEEAIATEEGMPIEGEAEMKTYPIVFLAPDGAPEPQWEPQAMVADLRRWKARAIKAVKAGKAADVRFGSDAIPVAEQARIREALGVAQSAGDVVRAFEGGGSDETDQESGAGTKDVDVGVVADQTTTKIPPPQERAPLDASGAGSLGDRTDTTKSADPTDALIDAEFGAALAWAKKAME